MFSKFSNKKLAIIFLVLLLAAAAVIIIDNSGTESTFDKDIISVDSAKVSKIVLYPKSQNHKEVNIIKQNGHWLIQTAPGKFKPVPAEKANEIINTVMKIQPLRLAGKNVTKWKEYQVDTAGTRLEIYEGNKKTLDIIIGKFTFQQPRNMTTFVRMTDDKNVYAVDGFLEFIFNKPAGSFRNETLVNLHSDEIIKINLNYKPDSSFTLERSSGKWTINGLPADSAKTADYIRSLSNLSSSDYADLTWQNAPQSGNLIIQTSNKTVQLSFRNNIITSSQNKDEIFYGNKILKQIIKAPSDFRKSGD